MDGNSQNDGLESNSIIPSRNRKEVKNSTTSVVIHNRDNQNINHSNFQYHPNAKHQHQLQHNGGGSTKSKISHDIRSHKNSSSSYSKNSTNSHRSTTQHYHVHQTNVFGNKMKNNIGHKVSQTKRIQLSTAAKRCKSIEKSTHAGDNNSKAINHDNICKADDYVDNNNEDDNSLPLVNALSRQIKDDLSANNSTQTQSTESPTLVRVKMWHTDSCVILPHHMA